MGEAEQEAESIAKIVAFTAGEMKDLPYAKLA
jgi:hypothetical protein